MKSAATNILNSTFGFKSFRPLQGEVVEAVVSGRDAVVIMPTGGGKSLCYQIPALLFDGLTIVVSPLISLMQDQVSQLRLAGVAASFLNSSLSAADYSKTLNKIKTSSVTLLYVAPETLMKAQIIALLKETKVSCIAIDESHCISEWGHDFRPEYRKLAGMHNDFPGAVFLALTATATPRVRQDIISTLRLDDAKVFISSFDRANLHLQVSQKENPVRQVVEVIQRFPNQSGIVYCATRRQVDELNDALACQGYSVTGYHAGMTNEERRRNQHAFVRDNVQVVIATIAFGMGIDKPNVRYVIHYDLPKNIEGYYQEIGRAGRDGLDAFCLLLFSYADIYKIRYFIEQKTDKEKRMAHIHLGAMVAYAESALCRRIPLLNYFGEEYSVPAAEDGCGMCDNCLSAKRDPEDLTVAAQKFMSCVKRTGENFGIVHVVDVLLGRKNKKVLQYGHQHLSTYGIGSEFSKKQWSYLARQLLQHDLLTQDGSYAVLKLTDKAWSVLRGTENFYGLVLQDSPAVKMNAGAAKMEIDYDERLFSKFRSLRKRLAEEANVPPYAIFPDKTLIELAARLPQSPEQMLLIHGVGQVKVQKYGKLFLAEIEAFCTENNIDRKPHSDGPFPVPDVSFGFTPQRNKKLRHHEVGELFNSGKSIAQCMARYNVKAGTIISHLERYSSEGNRLRRDGLHEALNVDGGLQKEVTDSFADMGYDRLTPIYEKLQGRLDYDTLKLIRLLESSTRD